MKASLQTGLDERVAEPPEMQFLFNEPHGGKLINRFVSRNAFDLENIDAEVSLARDQISEVRNIATGLYSPLTGYMNKDDYESVLSRIKLSNGVPWSIPLIFPLPRTKWNRVKAGSQILLKETRKGKEIDLGILKVSDKFEIDKEQYCKSIYGTCDKSHPGVQMINLCDDYSVGGDLWIFDAFAIEHPHCDFTPEETRRLFLKKGWKTVVGFQTRNPAHRAHEFIQKMALEFVDGLFINPIIGAKKPGDFKDEVILKVYKELAEKFFPENSCFVSIYNSRMYYAGPREAVFHAIVRKNFGCTHFIVGRDHAGVMDYYDKLAAHRIFDEIGGIGMEIMKVSNAFFCRRCDLYTTAKLCPHHEIYRISPSGTQVREYIKNRDYSALKPVMRDEVLDVIFSFDEPFVV
jgi:sulfate adenylyltransferase